MNKVITAVEQVLEAMQDIHGSVVITETEWTADLSREIANLRFVIQALQSIEPVGLFGQHSDGVWLQFHADHPRKDEMMTLYKIGGVRP